jgi:predicted GNAT family acetyltransferase
MKLSISPDQINVEHNPEGKCFEVKVESYTAKAEYILTQTRIIFTHTEVPVALEGNGIGAALAKTGLDYARENDLKVMPLCPFFASYMRRHPEYKDLLVAGINI